MDRHKIFEASDFFRAACSGNWIEARERTVVLDGIPARYFTLYVDWVYNKSLPSTPCFDAPFDGWIGEPVVEPECTGLQLHFWCQLWIFADFLGDKGLMKFCLRAIERHVEWRGANRFFPIFLPETVELLLNETSERSDLREWIPMMWWRIPCLRRMMSFKVMGFAHVSGKNYTPKASAS